MHVLLEWGIVMWGILIHLSGDELHCADGFYKGTSLKSIVVAARQQTPPRAGCFKAASHSLPV